MALHSRFLLRSIFWTFVLPLTVVYFLSKTLPDWISSTYARTLLYVLAVPANDLIFSSFSGRRRAAEAKRLGAKPIPRIRGKLPGNIDILWELVTSGPKEYCADTLRKWTEKYGPTLDMNILWAHQIVTVDPENIKEILATRFQDFEKGEKFHDMFESFLGTGIFTSDGETWKFHRSMARPFFVRERVSDFDYFERHSAKVISIMEHMSARSEACDFQDLFQKFTLDTTTEFLFGSCTNTLDAPDNGKGDHNRYADFARAFDRLQDIVVTRVRIGSTWPLFELFGDKSKGPMRIINAFIDPILKHAMRDRKNLLREDVTFLDYLVRTVDDEKTIRDALCAKLLAGRDTTASLLTFSTYALALHPEAMLELRKEVLRTVGQMRAPTPADIRSMKYLRAFINEVLRLFPSLPVNIRRSVVSSALPSPLSKMGPLYMQDHVSITYSLFLMQRRADVWGGDAEMFKPERWLDIPGQALQTKPQVANPFIFLPFNGGPRMCLGQGFAYQECSYLLIRLLQRFRAFDFAPDAQPLVSLPPKEWAQIKGRASIERCRIKSSLVLYAEGGMWLRARAADGSESACPEQ